jgi:hypothetical protein
MPAFRSAPAFTFSDFATAFICVNLRFQNLAMDPILTKLRQICLALPDTKETFTWGNPHFRVGEKIFCGYTDHDDSKGGTGGPVIGCKLEKSHARDILADPRFGRSPRPGPRKLPPHRAKAEPTSEGRAVRGKRKVKKR